MKWNEVNLFVNGMKRNEQINERQWNGINQRRTKGANRPRQALQFFHLFCWLALRSQAKEVEELALIEREIVVGYGPAAPLPRTHSLQEK